MKVTLLGADPSAVDERRVLVSLTGLSLIIDLKKHQLCRLDDLFFAGVAFSNRNSNICFFHLFFKFDDLLLESFFEFVISG